MAESSLRDDRSEIARSVEYSSFRSSVPLQHISVQIGKQTFTWRLFDHGPRTIKNPIVFLPPVSGTADVWFRQMMPLASLGFRSIALSYPEGIQDIDTFCTALAQLCSQLKLKNLHMVGASLGAFLAQKFAQFTSTQPDQRIRVASLFLINGFTDTAVFDLPPPTLLKCSPLFFLRWLLLDNLRADGLHPDIAESTDFMVERLEELTRRDLLSRLLLNIKPAYVEPHHITNQGVKVTIMDVNDDCVISDRVKDDLYKSFPQAKLAQLKEGGNFPYLARSDEVNIFIKIHLMRFAGTAASACDSDSFNATGPILDEGEEDAWASVPENSDGEEKSPAHADPMPNPQAAPVATNAPEPVASAVAAPAPAVATRPHGKKKRSKQQRADLVGDATFDDIDDDAL
ncbi:uncharacterized protein MONBRDRAFT_7702 [Monosiga brevicollis MX1]|uniref:Maspardin n=1 Tax=Monosiga brevicollis TaxID=81824 RepID=A9UY23_MONBE|nr:uncharacterized protein MONBRDRAFT_7702 [Monosiga brevicollis MX1]EDQ89945.1 predicted protein [Monosiga brevicollis MX1]|eukprot:XP_001745367.1 hypothetical protein [Monosiga brevicollis MX1]